MALGAIVALAWWLARPPGADAFYDREAAPGTAPGTLVASEPFARDVPEGARGWRILYATTRHDGRPATASALVVVEAGGPAPRPAIGWAHGTTGIAQGCAPSLSAQPFANMPAWPEALAEGWALVAPDYPGLGTPGGHAYLVGEDSARAVLDALVAAQALEGADIGPRAVVWGHSQGGHSALWAGIRSADAPGVEILGVAAAAPASDLPALVEAVGGTLFGKIISAYIARAYDAAYPGSDAWGHVAPGLRVAVRDMAGRCVGGWPTLLSAGTAALLPREGIFARPATEGAFGDRLADNVPDGPFRVPVLIGQGAADDLVLAPLQADFVRALCADGATVDYRLYEGRDHLSLVAPDSPFGADLLDWTRARLAGRPAAASCP